MHKISIILILFGVCSCVITEKQVCEVKNIETCKRVDQTEILEVLVNSSKLQLNNTNLIDYLEITRLNLDFENVTLELISEQKDQYQLAARRQTCLENVTKCLAEDVSFRTARERFSSLLFSLTPPIDLASVPGVSETCRQQTNFFKKELNRMSYWALKMYDATAKLPSGLLSGNVNQLGDFDECLTAKSPDEEVRGQYCLAYLQVASPQHSVYLDVLHDLVQSHGLFRSHLNDPGHRVPRFSSIHWALCVPDGCSTRDIELGLAAFSEQYLEPAGLQVQVQVNQEMCYVMQDNVVEQLPTSTILGGAFFLVYIFITLLATIYDHKVEQPKNDTIVAFSLKKNWKSLVSLNRAEDDIACVHGIRFLNALMLLAAHKSMALFYNPYMNRAHMAEMLGQPWSVLGRAASLYTDPFIMISGMLTAHSFVGKLNRSGKVDVVQEYISRLFRLIPPLAALILFCTLILPWVGSGPQWNLVVTHHAEMCKNTWWRNLLFIHNYFGFENMCLTHTHHVGIDTQLFALSPLLIWLIWKWPRRGFAALFTLAAISTMMRYYVTYTKKLNNYVHYGTSVQQLFDTANYMYILPAHRLTVYIIGIVLGYALRKTKQVNLDKVKIKLGDALAMLLFCLAFFGPAFMGRMDYKYNPTDAAWYAAFAPIAWCLSYGWIIYKSHFGHEGAIGRFFSARFFLVTTRLSYAVYLTQFPIFFYNVGITRSSEEYSFVKMQINIPELFNVVFYSVILTLLFDSPFQNIKKVLFRKPRAKVPNTNGTIKETKND